MQTMADSSRCGVLLTLLESLGNLHVVSVTVIVWELPYKELQNAARGGHSAQHDCTMEHTSGTCVLISDVNVVYKLTRVCYMHTNCAQAVIRWARRP